LPFRAIARIGTLSQPSIGMVAGDTVFNEGGGNIRAPTRGVKERG